MKIFIIVMLIYGNTIVLSEDNLNDAYLRSCERLASWEQPKIVQSYQVDLEKMNIKKIELPACPNIDGDD